ncbi:hypothetical protein PPERSA_12919 [Pseudocohnilembus persalinus]|uniref:EF-hand domain-containing protein n=1 Tax=Pseudocohnilembus persalinus TaxID=266149 RepID=A0A0V0R1M5_PSEPJ|nr:hypothetical protein PPERSA_12919 [Pseudocohnilembus persalinus]|eukprot:KRX08438.1 hypothetical protein PPERSA_12919 [Pseudocohnilembus persalinus]
MSSQQNQNNINNKYRKRNQPEEVSKLRLNAEKYLRDNRIVELFEDIASKLCYDQVPSKDIDQYVIKELEKKQEHGFSTGVYTEGEIENIFNLFDLKNERSISKQACIEAIKVMISSEYQNNQVDFNSQSVPDRVDFATFKKLCKNIAGISQIN